MTTPDVTVIVITHNRATLLDEMLGSIATQTWTDGWDVVVVDNASTDHTSDVLDRWRDDMPVELTVVPASEGSGPAYARNTGARHARARRLLFVDDDDILAAGWLTAMASALRIHRFVANRHDFALLNDHEVASADTTGVDGLSQVGATPVASGAGFGCDADLWHELGGMNEALRYGEDIDFSLRASAAGFDPHFVADATYHMRLRTGARAAFARGRHFGEASVDLYVRHGRERGQRPDPIGLIARVWAAYVARIPTLTNHGRRLVYAQQVGRRVGRLQGSLRARVWFP